MWQNLFDTSSVYLYTSIKNKDLAQSQKTQRIYDWKNRNIY